MALGVARELKRKYFNHARVFIFCLQRLAKVGREKSIGQNKPLNLLTHRGKFVDFYNMQLYIT